MPDYLEEEGSAVPENDRHDDNGEANRALAALGNGRRLRVLRRRIRRPIEGRVERIVPSGEGINLFLLTKAGCPRLGPADIVAIEDLDTGEVVAEAGVTPWLWGELLDQEVQRHGGVRLEVAIDALPIRDLGPKCAAAIAGHFRTFRAFLDCADRAAAQWGTTIAPLDDMVRDKLIRFHHDEARYGAYGGSFVPTPGMPDAVALDALLELMEPDGIGSLRAEAIVEAVATGKVARALSTILAGRTVLDWRPPARSRAATGPLRGHRLVFTGTLDGFSRADAKQAAEQAGAIVDGSLSASTTLLVAGAGAGEKLPKARQRGVQIVSEDGFVALLAGEDVDEGNEDDG